MSLSILGGYNANGPTPNKPKYSGILNPPKQSNIGAGLILGSTQTVANPIKGGGQPGTINVPKTNTAAGTPLPAGWNSGSGLAIPRSLGGSTTPDSSTKSYAGLLNTPPKATTPLKKTTVNNVDGSSTTHEYHPEPQPKTTTPKSTPTPLAPYQPPATAQYPDMGSSSNPAPQTPAPDQAQIIRNIQQAGQMTPQEQAANEEVRKANELQKSYQNVAALAPYAEAGMYSDRARTPEEIQAIQQAPDLAGRASATFGLTNSLSDIYGSSRVAGANAALQGVQTQAARNLTAQQGAGSLNAPTSQFGLLTNPVTGQIIGGEGSNAQQLMNTSLSKAIELYNSGKTSFADAINISGLGQFGELGKSLLSSALIKNNDFNPTSQNTQINTNQTNLDSTQKQAYSVNQSLQQVDKIEPVLTNFLQNSGINPFEAQLYNGPVNDYLRSIGNSGAAAQWGAQMSELKNYTSQLIASGYGGTPSGAEEATLSQDPSNLSYQGLKAYLQTLKDLGNNRLNVLQGDIQKLGGTGVGYTGNAAPTATSTTPAPSAAGSGEVGTGITSAAGQYGAGLGLNIVPGLASAATQGGLVAAGAKILKFIGL